MRSFAFLACLVVSSVASAAVTGSGVKLTETRKIGAFSKLDVSDGVQLEVRKGAPSLTIEGDDNVVPLYVTEVVGDELRIHRTTKDWLRTKLPLVVKVTTPSLARLEASGGVEVSLEGVAAPAFALNLSGGVELEARGLELDALSLDASGGVQLHLDGRVKKAKVDVSGGVALKAPKLEVGELSVDASGGCELDVGVKDMLVGDASGGVGITVHGRPAKAKLHTSADADVSYVD